MSSEVYDSAIRNNMIFSRHAGSSEHDVPINVDRGHDIDVLHNTIFLSHASGYANAIEYRYAVSSGLRIHNNLTNRGLRARDSASADLAGNLTDAQASWFVDAASGDLHLSRCDLATVADAGDPTTGVTHDLDGEDRQGRADLGADHCMP